MSIKSRLRNWLEIKDPIIPRDLAEDFEKIEKQLWRHHQLLKKRVTVKCEGCKKSLLLWPLETEAYYFDDGKHWHKPCKPTSVTPKEKQ